MKKNKIIALAMLCGIFLSPVSKAHETRNTKQEIYTQKIQKTGNIDDIVKLIFGVTFIGSSCIYVSKKGINAFKNQKAKKITAIGNPEKPKVKITKPLIQKKSKKDLVLMKR